MYIYISGYRYEDLTLNARRLAAGHLYMYSRILASHPAGYVQGCVVTGNRYFLYWELEVWAN